MRRLLVPVALLLVMALPALGALDGSISGVVKDNSGQPLPGVSVTVKGPVLQGTRTAITKGDGTYRVPSLPPGKGYLVSFLLSGFKVVTRSELSVGLNLDTQVNSTMDLADVQTEIVVTGEAPVVDVTQTNTATNFNSDYLRNVPVGAANRSYQSLLGQAPGVTGGSNPNVLGGSTIENSYMIDGINTTDPITHTWTVQMNFDTIQEVSVQTSGFEAEYGKATGGVVNVVTKSGGNDFSGTFDIRYRTSDMEKSGDHYDPNKAESRRTPWGATLGGPILKDNLWFFANMRRPDQYQIPYSAVPAYLAANPNPAIYRYTGWDYGGKLSFTLSPSYSGFFNYYNSSASIENPDLSVQRLPEAVRNQDQATETFNLKLTGVFTSSWIGEFQAGQNENEVTSYPRSGDLSATQWQNRLTGVVYGGYSNSQGGPRNRKLIGANTSYFLADFVGNHQFKTGFDIDNTKYPSYSFTTGTPTDPSFCPTGLVCGATGTFAGFDASGAQIPYSQAVTTRNPTYERRADGFSAYIQDSWRPTSRLTVNLGVRYDETAMFNNQDLQVMQFQRFQPRLAVAYDITGDGKTVARANYGQFYHEPGLTIVRGLDTGVYTATTRNYRWNTTTKTWGFVNQTGGTLLTAPLVDPELRGPYDDAVGVAFEREIVRNLSFTASYNYKKTNRMLEDTCIDYVDCADFIITNQPGKAAGLSDELKHDYYAYTFMAEYRFLRGMINASYVYSKSRGSTDVGGTQYIGADFDWYDPTNPDGDNFRNMYGYLGDDARNRFKIFGNYMIPYIETNLGANYTYRSGFPWAAFTSDPSWGTFYQEARGSRRGPVLHNLDLNLEKRIPLNFVSNRLSVSVIGSVYNIFNTEQITGYQGNLENTAYGQPTSWVQPLRYELGFRVDF